MGMRGTPDERRTYSDLLEALASTHPLLAASLRRAEATRRDRLEQYFSGVRLRGIEELLLHLDTVEPLVHGHNDLGRIAFLIRRARADFETAVEAGLTGLHAVAFDAMRDVMEIEFLLRDFLHEPGHIEEWLNADEKARRNRFGPGELRRRHAQRMQVQPQDMVEAKDYRAHSVFLHVNPVRNPLGDKGFSSDQDAITADTWFQELFEHARRLVIIIHELLVRFGLAASPDLATTLIEFRQAWERTQDMRIIYLSLMDAVCRESESSSEEALGESP
jgi:hypothetical protein